MQTRIVIVKIRKPARTNLNEELQWFGNSLGLFNLRDTNKSVFRLFIELLKAAKTEHPLSSDELAERLQLTRGTVVHHIHRMMQAGIVEHKGRRYMLAERNLEILMDDMKKEFEKTYNELKEAARKIDTMLEM
jgi:predicted transcriptional regulator